MTKLIATMALAGLLLATLACRTAEVVERAAPGPPTVTPRPSFDSFNYPTNVPTPIPDFDRIGERLNAELATRGLATVSPKAATGVGSSAPRGRGATVQVFSDEECAAFRSTIDGLRGLGTSDTEIMDEFLAQGLTPAGVRATLGGCGVELDATPQAPAAVIPYRTPTALDCQDFREGIAEFRALGLSDQVIYNQMLGAREYTKAGLDLILRQTGECGIRMDAVPVERHADFLVFQ